jgi:GTP cyclohydrolase I
MFDVDCKDVVIIKDIEFNSLCEHHAMPFFGKVHIAYIPNGKVVGLSKFARLVEGYANRLQVQERLNQQLINAIQDTLNPEGVMVVIEAEHTCMTLRGIKNKGALTTTMATRGLYSVDENKRNEILRLIK